MQGYILLARNIIESQIWRKPPLYLKVWIYLLVQSQHADYKKLKRGQLSTSIPEIIDACYWYVGYRKEKPTKDQIFQIIDWLRNPCETSHEAVTKATMITTMKATQTILITIDNYCYYQNPKNYESNDESNDEKVTEATRKQRQPNNINKNVKNEKNIKNIYAEFVTMTNAEYEKLVSTYGEEFTKQCINVLDNYKGQYNKKYACDYRAILNWVVEKVKNQGVPKQQYQPPKTVQQQNLDTMKEWLQEEEANDKA